MRIYYAGQWTSPWRLLEGILARIHLRWLRLKRGMSATVTDLLMSAEYILSQGNPNVVLCERGVKGFDPATRNLFDVAAVPLVHTLSHLPIIVDPSHATGRPDLIPACALAGLALAIALGDPVTRLVGGGVCAAALAVWTAGLVTIYRSSGARAEDVLFYPLGAWLVGSIYREAWRDLVTGKDAFANARIHPRRVAVGDGVEHEQPSSELERFCLRRAKQRAADPAPARSTAEMWTKTSGPPESG